MTQTDSGAIPQPTMPPILRGAGALLERYEVLLCDVWGVLHDGRTAFAAAGEALLRFRQGGGTVVLLSNAPYPHDRVAQVLDDKGVRRDAWDTIVASGDITLAHVAEAGYQRQHRLGPLPRDAALFDRLPGAASPLETADVLVVSGLLNDRRESAETYRALLLRALDRRLPLICANPDLVVDVGGRLLPCAGAIATLYERMGGAVFWAGKPHAAAYSAARAAAERLRGGAVAPASILAIGDSLRTDVAGAQAAGLDALLVGHGIHRHELMPDGEVLSDRLAALLAEGPRPVAAMAALAW